MNHFFSKALIAAPARIKTTSTLAHCRLDKNEQSEDVHDHWKEIATQALRASNWNRYPNADLSDIETQVAQYCGLASDQITLGPGSASIITTLLNFFAINGKKIVITHPSYSLFEYHCNTYNIPFTPWLLNESLNFDLQNLPDLDAQSVLIITSPNNPTGNSIDRKNLVKILEQNPETMVIIDGVYTEFAQDDFTTLVNAYSNLMVIRSFSKAFPIAGLRLGYLCADKKLTLLLKKLMLPFSINTFTLCFAREILFRESFMSSSQKRLKQIIAERERMKLKIMSLLLHDQVTVYPSEGNFLLMGVKHDSDHTVLLQLLHQKGIQVLNTSTFALLKNTIRVSIGNRGENDHFLACIASFANQITKMVEGDIVLFPLQPASLHPKISSIRYN